MKQQADKEMTSIRRILDILSSLTQSQQTRVMAFVNGRIADGSIAAPPPTKDVKLVLPASAGVDVRPVLELPFPQSEETKRVMDAMAKNADQVLGALGVPAAILGTSSAKAGQ